MANHKTNREHLHWKSSREISSLKISTYAYMSKAMSKKKTTSTTKTVLLMPLLRLKMSQRSSSATSKRIESSKTSQRRRKFSRSITSCEKKCASWRSHWLSRRLWRRNLNRDAQSIRSSQPLVRISTIGNSTKRCLPTTKRRIVLSNDMRELSSRRCSKDCTNCARTKKTFRKAWSPR